MKQIINSREIIKELVKKGLHVVDKGVLNYYIRNFNYNTFIYGYSEPFLINLDQKKYDSDASSDQMINLFKFDRDLANHILRFILVIEKIMNTNVAYGIINEYGIKDKCLFKLNNNFIQHHIFTNINEINPKTNYINLAIKLVKYLPTNTATKNFYERNSNDEIYRWRNCPLDLMCLTWSFATTFSIFIALDSELRKRIIENFGIPHSSLNGFVDFTKNVLHLRNMISHNNVIFNFTPTHQSQSIFDMYKFIFNRHINKLTLINLIELIEFFSHSKTLISNTKYYFNKLKIEQKFKDKINLFNEQNTI